MGCPPRYKFFIIFFLPQSQPLMFFRLKLSVTIVTF